MLTDMIKKSLPVLAAMLLSCALHAAPLPDFEASYQLKRGNLRIGTMVVELKTATDGSYQYESRSWPARWASWLFKDKLFETSHGHIIDGQVRPDRYHYMDTSSTDRYDRIAITTCAPVAAGNAKRSCRLTGAT